MRSDDDVRAVFALHADGLNPSQIARATSVSRAQIRAWVSVGAQVVLDSPMRARRREEHKADVCTFRSSVAPAPYAYLLGQYLGDGTLTRVKRGTLSALRLFTCDAYPRIRQECVEAISAVKPSGRVTFLRKEGCTELRCFWTHWPCLFPQCGPGLKHLRPIALEPWQRAIAIDGHPDAFVRGLIHSDGCRCLNRVTVRGKRYEYPRYFFSNRSADIRYLFIEACAQLGVEARHSNRWNVSVARRASVARLDEVVGPKS